MSSDFFGWDDLTKGEALDNFGEFEGGGIQAVEMAPPAG